MVRLFGFLLASCLAIQIHAHESEEKRSGDDQAKTHQFTQKQAGSGGQFKSHQSKQKRGGFSQGSFDTVLEYVDESTASELTALRDDLNSQREKLVAMRSDPEVDRAQLGEFRTGLKSSRQELMTRVREIVAANPELQQKLESQQKAARSDRLIFKYALSNEDAFAQLLAAAENEQAQALQSNKDAMVVLRDQLRGARQSGENREGLAQARSELQALGEEQKALVTQVLSQNEDLHAQFLSEAEASVSERRKRGFGRQTGFTKAPES